MIDANTRVVLRSPRFSEALVSWVEPTGETRLDRFAIALPARGGVEIPLEAGEELELEWVADECTRQARVRVVGDAKGRVASVFVEPVDQEEGIQRRDNVRLPVALGLQVWELVGEDEDEPPPMIGSVYDLSGGGMQARIPQDIGVGDRFLIRFELPGERGVVESEAVVRRHIAGDVYGLEFVGMPPADRERIIRTIFSIMREQLARRSGRGA